MELEMLERVKKGRAACLYGQGYEDLAATKSTVELSHLRTREQFRYEPSLGN
jgi:hypothetical protein